MTWVFVFFSCFALLGCTILIPIDAVYNVQHISFTEGYVRESCLFVERTLHLHRDGSARQNTLGTLIVSDVLKKYQSDEGIHAIFESPYPTTLVNIGREVGRIPEFVRYRNTAVHELE